MDKEDVVYINTMEYYSAIKKNEILLFETTMDGHGEHYVKWNKSDRERQITYDVSYMCNLKTKNQAHGYRKPMVVARGKGLGVEDMCELFL